MLRDPLSGGFRLRLLTKSWAAAVVALLAGGPAAAHTGDHTFLEAVAEAGMARRVDSVTTDPRAQAEVVKEIADLLPSLPNPQGRTMLPPGSVCDSAEIDGGSLVVRYTLPADLAGFEFSEMAHDTIAMALTHLFVAPFQLTAVRIEAREHLTKATSTAYRGFETFVPAAPKTLLDTRGQDKMAPAAPGPDYASFFAGIKKMAESHAIEATAGQTQPKATGQGPVAVSTQPSGALSGRVVYFSAGHGWYYDSTTTSWKTQRPLLLQMCEDYGNVDQTNFMAAYLFNAGATVVCMRPLGYQTNEVVLDNESAQVTYTGAWTLGATSTDNYGNAAGNTVRHTTTAASETHTATFTPAIPEAGWYPVYAFANASTNRTSAQVYRVRHSGGESQVTVNHRRVGRGWVWLGTYYFSAGSNGATGSVVVGNQLQSGAVAGAVIADAIRFGNGMGDINRGGGVSGFARETEANNYWLEKSEAPSTVANSGSSDLNSSIGGPPRMASYMHNDDSQGYNAQIYLGYHSNASNTTVRGSVGLITDSASVTNQAAFAALVSNILDEQAFVEDSAWEHVWGNYGSTTLTAAYGEIGSGLGGDMCGTIVEVAFHDNAADAELLRDPKVRNVVARTQTHAIIQYFNTYGGGPAAYAPVPPERVRARNNGTGGVTVAWAPVAAAASALRSQAASGYRVYRSTDGLNFGNPVTVAGNATVSTLITGLALDQIHYFRVSAVNGGGESMPSEVVAVRLRSGPVPVLIVNGYDRLDRYNNVPEFPSNPTDDRVERLHLRQNNSYDYVRQHGAAVAASGRWFDSCSNEAVINSDVPLGSYETVIWISGEESSADNTFDATERTRVQAFLNTAGKSLFVSGSEIGYQMDGLSVSPTFYNSYLRADYASDSANTYQASGAPGSVLDGVTVDFSPSADIYDVDSADVLSPINGSTAAMNYAASGATVDSFDGLGSWQDPNFSGTTNADAASAFTIVSSPTYEGTGAGRLSYVWGAGTTIREYNNGLLNLPSASTLSLRVYGDNSGNTLRLLIRDSDGELFQGPATTINFTGWQEVTWNIPSAPTSEFASVAGDNVITGPTVRLDSILLTRNGGPASGNLYFDKAAYVTSGTGGVAAVQYSGTSKVVTFGFPFEAIGSSASRTQVMDAVLDFFATPVPVTVSEFSAE